MSLKKCIVFVHSLSKSKRDMDAKRELETDLKAMGAEIAKQKRKASLTHVVLSRNPSATDFKAEQDDISRLAYDVGQLRSAPILLRAAWVAACKRSNCVADENQFKVKAKELPLVDRILQKNSPKPSSTGKRKRVREPSKPKSREQLHLEELISSSQAIQEQDHFAGNEVEVESPACEKRSAPHAHQVPALEHSLLGASPSQAAAPTGSETLIGVGPPPFATPDTEKHIRGIMAGVPSPLEAMRAAFSTGAAPPITSSRPTTEGGGPQSSLNRTSLGSSSHSRGTPSARAPFTAPRQSASAARLDALRASLATAQAERAVAEAASRLAQEQLAAELTLQLEPCGVVSYTGSDCGNSRVGKEHQHSLSDTRTAQQQQQQQQASALKPSATAAATAATPSWGDAGGAGAGEGSAARTASGDVRWPTGLEVDRRDRTRGNQHRGGNNTNPAGSGSRSCSGSADLETAGICGGSGSKDGGSSKAKRLPEPLVGRSGCGKGSEKGSSRRTQDPVEGVRRQPSARYLALNVSRPFPICLETPAGRGGPSALASSDASWEDEARREVAIPGVRLVTPDTNFTSNDSRVGSRLPCNTLSPDAWPSGSLEARGLPARSASAQRKQGTSATEVKGAAMTDSPTAHVASPATMSPSTGVRTAVGDSGRGAALIPRQASGTPMRGTPGQLSGDRQQKHAPLALDTVFEAAAVEDGHEGPRAGTIDQIIGGPNDRPNSHSHDGTSNGPNCGLDNGPNSGLVDESTASEGRRSNSRSAGHRIPCQKARDHSTSSSAEEPRDNGPDDVLYPEAACAHPRKNSRGHVRGGHTHRRGSAGDAKTNSSAAAASKRSRASTGGISIGEGPATPSPSAGMQPVLALSNCDDTLQQLAKATVGELGGMVMCVAGREEAITHLVMGPSTTSANSRTFKLMLAITNGAHILDPGFLTASREAGQWLPEDDFATTYGFKATNGQTTPYAVTAKAVRSRLAAAAARGEARRTVLDGTRVHVVARAGGHRVSTRNPAMKEMMGRLVRALGGEIVLKKDCKVCIVVGDSPKPTGLQKKQYPLKDSWILDAAATQTKPTISVRYLCTD